MLCFANRNADSSVSALVFERIDLILQELLRVKEKSPGDVNKTSSIIIEDLLPEFLYIEGALVSIG